VLGCEPLLVLAQLVPAEVSLRIAVTPSVLGELARFGVTEEFRTI